jgi:predicted dehydrogenase
MNAENNPGRRDFLGKIAAYSGSVVILGGLGWAGSRLAETDEESIDYNGKPVRVGVVGTGSRGNLLLELMLSIPSIQIIAICDNYPPNLKLGFDIMQGKATTYVDHRKMFEQENLDAVVVATPLHQHAPVVLDAFSAGLHVFCEKTMARTVGECVSMVKASQEAGKVFQTGLQRMFDRNYLTFMEMLKNNHIGKITQIRAYWHRNNDWRRPVPSPELERKINWRLYHEYSCGLMTELAAHHIQVANWVLNDTPIRVMGSGSLNYWKDGREVYDNVNLVYEYPGGIHLDYDSLISNKHYGAEVQVMGDKGTFEMESGLFYSENPPPSPGILQLINNIEHGIFDAVNLQGTSWAPELITQDKPNHVNPGLKNPDSSREQLVAFAGFVLKGQPVPEITKQGFNASVATLYGDMAIKENRIITIPDEHRM